MRATGTADPGTDAALARRILPQILANTRDCGGLPTNDGGVLRTGHLLRTASLCEIRTDAAVSAVARAIGPAVYVDLRSDVEVDRDGGLAQFVERGWRWVRMPLSDRSLESAGPGNAGPSTGPHLPAPEHFLDPLPRYLATAAAVVRLLGHGPVIVGCSAGKDRTGLVIALLLRWFGVPRDAIVADFVLTNRCLAEGRALLPARWRDPAHPLGLAHGPALEAALDAADRLGPAAAPPPDLARVVNVLSAGETS